MKFMLLELFYFMELGAAHSNICRLKFEFENEGAAHRNTKKYCGALHLSFSSTAFILQILTRRCRFQLLLYSR